MRRYRVVAINKTGKVRWRMSDKTREKNVTTKVCNIYRTYRTSKMLSYW